IGACKRNPGDGGQQHDAQRHKTSPLDDNLPRSFSSCMTVRCLEPMNLAARRDARWALWPGFAGQRGRASPLSGDHRLTAVCAFVRLFMLAVVADLPVKLGPMAAVPPAFRYRVKDMLGIIPGNGGALEAVPLERLGRLFDEGEPWLGADPALAEIGHWMLE